MNGSSDTNGAPICGELPSATVGGLTLLEQFPSRTDREQVWIAQPEGVNDPANQVVVKLFATDPADVPNVLAAIEQRRILATRYPHKSIARILDTGSTSSAAYLVREYVLGFTLREVVESEASRGRRLPPWLALSTTCSAARTVGAIHDMLRAEDSANGCSSSILDPDNLIIGLDGNVMFLEFWMPTPDQIRRLARQSAPPSGWHDVRHPASERALIAAIVNLLLDLLVGVSEPGQVLDRVPAKLREMIQQEADATSDSTLRSFIGRLDELADQLQWNTKPQRVAQHMSLLFSRSCEASPPFEDFVPPPATMPYAGAFLPHGATAHDLAELTRPNELGRKPSMSSTLHGVSSDRFPAVDAPPETSTPAPSEPPSSSTAETPCRATDPTPVDAEPASINPLRDSIGSAFEPASNGPETPVRVGWEPPSASSIDILTAAEPDGPTSRRPNDLAESRQHEQHAWDRAIQEVRAVRQKTRSENTPESTPVARRDPADSAWDRAVRRLRAIEQADPTTTASLSSLPPQPIRDPVLRARRRFDEGLELVQAGRFKDALEPWLEAATLAPDNRLYQSNLRILRRRIEESE